MRINLAWADNSDDEAGFKVMHAPAGSRRWALLSTTAADATTCYSVADALGNTSGWSTVASFTTN